MNYLLGHTHRMLSCGTVSPTSLRMIQSHSASTSVSTKKCSERYVNKGYHTVYVRVQCMHSTCSINFIWLSHDYQVIEEDLKPNGRNIEVTEANKKEYIEWVMVTIIYSWSAQLGYIHTLVKVGFKIEWYWDESLWPSVCMKCTKCRYKVKNPQDLVLHTHLLTTTQQLRGVCISDHNIIIDFVCVYSLVMNWRFTDRVRKQMDAFLKVRSHMLQCTCTLN